MILIVTEGRPHCGEVALGEPGATEDANAFWLADRNSNAKDDQKQTTEVWQLGLPSDSNNGKSPIDLVDGRVLPP